jgi:hypothetical protein
MAAKKAPDLEAKMHETAPNEGEPYEADQASENDGAKHDPEKSSLTQVATEDQEYIVTFKIWIVVWVCTPFASATTLDS